MSILSASNEKEILGLDQKMGLNETGDKPLRPT